MRVGVPSAAAHACVGPADPQSELVTTALYAYTVSTSAVTPDAAVSLCWNDPLLSGPGVLVPAAHLLAALPAIVDNNVGVLSRNLKKDNAAGASSLWVLDPLGGCRAVSLPPNFATAIVAPRPCSWTLNYICMALSDVQSLAAQVSFWAGGGGVRVGGGVAIGSVLPARTGTPQRQDGAP